LGWHRFAHWDDNFLSLLSQSFLPADDGGVIAIATTVSTVVKLPIGKEFGESEPARISQAGLRIVDFYSVGGYDSGRWSGSKARPNSKSKRLCTRSHIMANQEPTHGQSSAKLTGKTVELKGPVKFSGGASPPISTEEQKYLKVSAKIHDAIAIKKQQDQADATQPVDEDALIEATSQRYDKLNQLWKQAEDQIKRFMVASEVVHVYKKESNSDDPNTQEYNFDIRHAIAWAKCKGAYRLCYGVYNELWELHMPDAGYEYTPILDASLEVRKACVPHFIELRKKVIEAAQSAIPALDDAIAQLSQSLKS
jgi:hypothetical protein